MKKIFSINEVNVGDIILIKWGTRGSTIVKKLQLLMIAKKEGRL